MVPTPEIRFALLVAIERASVVLEVEDALREARIPFQSGLQSSPSPRFLISVPEGRLEEARQALTELLTSDPSRIGSAPLKAAEQDEAGEEENEGPLEGLGVDESALRFPWQTVCGCLALVLVHLAIVFLAVGPEPLASQLVRVGGLVGGLLLVQPWRLLTHLLVHSDPRHVLTNGLSMVVFTVPLVARLGWIRTASVYLMAGIAGGLSAALAYSPQTVTVGSSGAVAGLFGAWLVLELRRTAIAPRVHRERLKLAGIALLVLPALVTPTTLEGNRISVASHLGGFAAGAFLGLLLGFARSKPPAQDDPPS